MEILQVVAQRKSRTATRVGKNDYYPFGLLYPGELCRADTTPVNRYRFNGMELVEDLGLDWYDYGARWYDAAIGRWNAVDPLAEDYTSYSPYNYTLNNPIVFIDPDGRGVTSTIVEDNEDGTYTVTGGDATDGDKGVYIDDGKGGKGNKIGESTTLYSFFYDNLTPVIGTTIDLGSTEGQDFLDGLVADDPSLITYAEQAKGLCPYDCKTLGMQQTASKEEQEQHMYRGSVLADGTIASARDVGNIGAGLVAARKGLPWGAFRIAADALETKQRTGTYSGIGYKIVRGDAMIYSDWHREAEPTQAAQRVGYQLGQGQWIKDRGSITRMGQRKKN